MRCAPESRQRYQQQNLLFLPTGIHLFLNMSRQVVDHIPRMSLHRAARRVDVSAAAEIRRHLAHIDIVVGTKADLVLVERLFIDENGTFHSFGNPELIDNAIQIVRIDTVKLHFFLGNHTENTSSIQNPCTAKQRFSENLVLCVGLAVKAVVDDLRRVHAFFHQRARDSIVSGSLNYT